MSRYALLLAAILPGWTWADFAYPVLTPVQKAAQAEYVFVGKIAEADKDPVLAAAYPYGQGMMEFKVVTIKIQERLLGANGVTQVRVGFAPMNLGPRRGQIPLEGLKTDVGSEACYFLVPHPSGDFFVPVPWGAPLDASAKDFNEQLAQVKKTTLAIADPMAALQVKDKDGRLHAAKTLLNRYRSSPVVAASGKGTLRQVEIPADESKLLLKALAEMPWQADAAGNGRANVWHLLALTEKDGYKAPAIRGGMDPNKILDQLTAEWLKKHQDTYRVKRFVVERGK